MLNISAALEKLQFVQGLTQIPKASHAPIPEIPGRDVVAVAPDQMPERPGFASNLGQRRLLHDLGNIEMQAMELC